MFQKIVVSLRRLFSYEKWVDLIVRFCVCKLSNRIFEQYLKIFVEHKSFGNDIRVDLNSLSNASPNGAK